jgi:hypothetical protein
VSRLPAEAGAVVSVEAGLAELASATAWQREIAEGACVDCGADALTGPGISIWTQRVVILKTVREWKVCERCLRRRMAEG